MKVIGVVGSESLPVLSKVSSICLIVLGSSPALSCWSPTNE
jgi:hypothetical protein